MLLHPFKIFEPFQSRITVALFNKSNAIRSDRDAAQRLGFEKSAGLHQVHGARVIKVIDQLNRTEEADGMITDQKGILLCIRAADCQNIVVYAPGKNVIGAMHVGWRCLEAGTIQAFYKLLKEEWDINPEETYVAAGPSLQKECAEFTDPTTELPSVPKECIHGRHVDLSGAADAQLIALGIPKNQIERMSDCTKCEPEKYWTYRGGDREAVKEGRTNMLCCGLV